jgi:hypothetical protein
LEASEIPKAVADGYEHGPFFYRDESPSGGVRWVAWPASIDALRDLFYRIIGVFPDEVDVLVKIRQWDQGKPGEERWQRYHGTCTRDRLLEAIGEHDDLVFRDGYLQLCVLCDVGGDYLALDDHGLFFLYTEDDGFAALCRNLGWEERRGELLSQQPHFHFCSSDFEEKRPQFISELGLRVLE